MYFGHNKDATCNKFLLAAPPGEFTEVFKDLEVILQNDFKPSPEIYKERNIDQMLVVQSPTGDHKVLITKFGEVNENEYLDPRGNCILKFDHIHRIVVSHTPISLEIIPHDISTLRSVFDNVVMEYVENYYVNGDSIVYAQTNEGSTIITICISSSKLNPNNWNARWRSVWICTFSNNNNNNNNDNNINNNNNIIINSNNNDNNNINDNDRKKNNGDHKIKISGTIKLHVHRYDDVNVQLNVTSLKEASTDLHHDDINITAMNVINEIEKIESEMIQSLTQTFQSMHQASFNALRRRCLISRPGRFTMYWSDIKYIPRSNRPVNPLIEWISKWKRLLP